MKKITPAPVAHPCPRCGKELEIQKQCCANPYIISRCKSCKYKGYTLLSEL